VVDQKWRNHQGAETEDHCDDRVRIMFFQQALKADFKINFLPFDLLDFFNQLQAALFGIVQQTLRLDLSFSHHDINFAAGRCLQLFGHPLRGHQG